RILAQVVRRYKFLKRTSIQIERPHRPPFVGLLLGAAHRLAELLFEETVAVFQGRHLALEDVLGARLVLVQTFEEGVEVLAAGGRLLGLAVGEDLAGGGVDHQIGAAFGATGGQLAVLVGHGPIVASSGKLRAMPAAAQLPGRDQAWNLLCRYTEKEALRKHALAVEAAMRSY